MTAIRFALVAGALLVAGSAHAGTGRQTTTFLVDGNHRAVTRWIEQNFNALDESTGAEVVAVRGPQSTLRKDTREGTVTFVVKHDVEQQGDYRTVLVRSDKSELVSQETQIHVESEGTGSRITIRAVATVSDHSPMAISLGIRPSIRGMRRLLEGKFGSPNEP